jgi:hypothetical protein
VKTTLPKGLPSINWWLDNDIIPAYHGTFSHKYHSIQEQGLLPGSSGLCYVSPSYLTAATFAIWGEHGIDHHIAKAFSGKLQIYHPQTYCVVHFGFPKAFIQKNGIYRTTGQSYRPPVLADRKLFDSFQGHPEEYYYFAECKFTCPVPAEYITAVSFPYT